MTSTLATGTPLPPHQHPFDWYVIPLVKGEATASFLEVDPSSGGWTCLLCELNSWTATTRTVEEHCHTWTHMENTRKLEQRRFELESLVREREKEIWKEIRQKEQQQSQQEEKEPVVDSQQASPPKRALTVNKPRKAVDTAPRDEMQSVGSGSFTSSSARAASIRDRLLAEKKEDSQLFEKANATESQHDRIRRLRAQRLSGTLSSSGSSDDASPPKTAMQRRIEERQREKEAKRIANLELTRKHQEKQRMEEAMAAGSCFDFSAACAPVTKTVSQAFHDAAYMCGLEESFQRSATTNQY